MTTRPQRRRRRRAADTGMSLAVVLLLLSLVSLSVVTLTSVAITNVRLAARGHNKMSALALAEAGVDDAANRLAADPAYAGTGGTVTLYADPPTNTKPLGTFTVQVTTPVASTPDLRLITSTGTTPSGAARTVKANFSGYEYNVGSDAMRSNGDIDINGDAAVKTVPVGQHNAHLRANKNIYLGNKTYDGGAYARGIVTGNPFGDKVSGAPTVPFPSAATIADWDAGWKAKARAGEIKTGDVSSSGGVTTAITGPCYISGNLIVGSNDTLTINGPGPVYVEGNVDLKGTLINKTNLIVKGMFEITALGEYSASGGTPPILIVLSSDPAAIKYRGGGATNQSVIYAMNGGIDVAGNSVCTGAMIAGGLGASIISRGTFDLNYPYSSLRNVSLGTPPTITGWIEM